MSEMGEANETHARFVLRLRTFCRSYLSACCLLYLQLVSVEVFVIPCFFYSVALRCQCSFALWIFINKSLVSQMNHLLFEVGRIF